MTPLATRRASVVASVACGVLVFSSVGSVAQTSAAQAPTGSPAAATRSAKLVKSRLIGRSVKGRKIIARLYGDPKATRVAVVIGSMHGTELAGVPIAKRLEQVGAPSKTALWVIRNLNPDGAKMHRRQNAHGVDLNRNSPHLWKPKAGGSQYYPGPRAMSEPETRAYVSFLHSVRPDLVLIYHQAGNAVDSYHQKNKGLTYGLAKRMNLPVAPFACNGVCTGTLTGWFNTNHPGVALTVELPARVSAKRVKKAARAARWAATYVPNRA